MPLDPAVLLQAKPIEVPNPLDLATKGLTLADIMNKVQAGDISLQQQRAMVAAMSDPPFLAAMAGLRWPRR